MIFHHRISFQLLYVWSSESVGGVGCRQPLLLMLFTPTFGYSAERMHLVLLDGLRATFLLSVVPRMPVNRFEGCVTVLRLMRTLFRTGRKLPPNIHPRHWITRLRLDRMQTKVHHVR